MFALQLLYVRCVIPIVLIIVGFRSVIMINVGIRLTNVIYFTDDCIILFSRDCYMFTNKRRDININL